MKCDTEQRSEVPHPYASVHLACPVVIGLQHLSVGRDRCRRLPFG